MEAIEMKIGLIGTGVMGSSIGVHLLNAGYDLTIYNRTKEKANTLIEKGAHWQDSPKKVSEQSDVLLTMVGSPEEVEEIYFRRSGIFESVRAGQILIDMTTSTPALAEKIAASAEKLGAQALDAPVSGGDIGAREGRLTVMVGGDQNSFDKVKAIMENFASKLRLFGPAGNGQHTKMANQIMVAGMMTGLIEMLAYAERANLPLEEVIQTVSEGAAQNRALDSYGLKIIQGDYSPGFFVKHFVKDLKIALEEAERMQVNLPSTKLAYELYQKLENENDPEEGVQALMKLWWTE